MGDELGSNRHALGQRFGRVVQHVPARVKYVWHGGVVCPVPIWDGELGIARQLLADPLEIKQIGAVPRQKEPVAVRALVEVDQRLVSPVLLVAIGQRLHRRDRGAIGLQDRIVRGQVSDVAPGWPVGDSLQNLFATAGGQYKAERPDGCKQFSSPKLKNGLAHGKPPFRLARRDLEPAPAIFAAWSRSIPTITNHKLTQKRRTANT